MKQYVTLKSICTMVAVLWVAFIVVSWLAIRRSGLDPHNEEAMVLLVVYSLSLTGCLVSFIIYVIGKVVLKLFKNKPLAP